MKNWFGIRQKIALISVVCMFILTFIIASIGYVQYNENVTATYVRYAEMVIESANYVFEDYKLGDMIVNRKQGEGYDEARQDLNRIKNASDVKYLYSIYFEDLNDIHSGHYVINAKTTEELEKQKDLPLEEIYNYLGEECEEDGYTDDVLTTLLESIKSGEEKIFYVESFTKEYGHLITCYRNVFDSNGNAVGIIGADIDVNVIKRDLMNYVKIVAAAATVFTLLVLFFFVKFTGAYIITPIINIAKSSAEFVTLMKGQAQPENLVYKDVTVRSKDEIRMLAEDIKQMAQGVREYMVNLRSVTAEKERTGAELNVATQIQADMLPRIFPPYPDRTEFDLYASMKPAKEVGGDFYDFFLVDDDHLALVMADVSGKGVPAALFMVIAKTLIKNRTMMDSSSPAEILSDVNDQLCEGNEAELFVTVWMAVIEISTGKGIAANAGHEHPALRHKDGKYEFVIYRHSPAVATMEGLRFREHEFKLEPGDSVFVYTDGVAEATDEHDELFGGERTLAALNREPGAEPGRILENVTNGINEFVGEAEQFDDITMLCLKYIGNDH